MAVTVKCAETSGLSEESMSKVKPLPFLAQGTFDCFTPQSSQVVRGTRTVDIGFEMKEVQKCRQDSFYSIMHAAACFAANSRKENLLPVLSST